MNFPTCQSGFGRAGPRLQPRDSEQDWRAAKKRMNHAKKTLGINVPFCVLYVFLAANRSLRSFTNGEWIAGLILKWIDSWWSGAAALDFGWEAE